MKKIKLLKPNELVVRMEQGVCCDFCGSNRNEGKLFTSEYDDCDTPHKCNMQICSDGVKQLYKLL